MVSECLVPCYHLPGAVSCGGKSPNFSARPHSHSHSLSDFGQVPDSEPQFPSVCWFPLPSHLIILLRAPCEGYCPHGVEGD